MMHMAGTIVVFATLLVLLLAGLLISVRVVGSRERPEPVRADRDRANPRRSD
jgi:hypothetical protein